MEAALFTLDVLLLIYLIRAVRKADQTPADERHLGLFSYLDVKTDQVQRGLRRGKGDPRA